MTTTTTTTTPSKTCELLLSRQEQALLRTALAVTVIKRRWDAKHRQYQPAPGHRPRNNHGLSILPPAAQSQLSLDSLFCETKEPSPEQRTSVHAGNPPPALPQSQSQSRRQEQQPQQPSQPMRQQWSETTPPPPPAMTTSCLTPCAANPPLHPIAKNDNDDDNHHNDPLQEQQQQQQQYGIEPMPGQIQSQSNRPPPFHALQPSSFHPDTWNWMSHPHSLSHSHDTNTVTPVAANRAPTQRHNWQSLPPNLPLPLHGTINRTMRMMGEYKPYNGNLNFAQDTVMGPPECEAMQLQQEQSQADPHLHEDMTGNNKRNRKNAFVVEEEIMMKQQKQQQQQQQQQQHRREQDSHHGWCNNNHNMETLLQIVLEQMQTQGFVQPEFESHLYQQLKNFILSSLPLSMLSSSSTSSLPAKEESLTTATTIPSRNNNVWLSYLQRLICESCLQYPQYMGELWYNLLHKEQQQDKEGEEQVQEQSSSFYRTNHTKDTRLFVTYWIGQWIQTIWPYPYCFCTSNDSEIYQDPGLYQPHRRYYTDRHNDNPRKLSMEQAIYLAPILRDFSPKTASSKSPAAKATANQRGDQGTYNDDTKGNRSGTQPCCDDNIENDPLSLGEELMEQNVGNDNDNTTLLLYGTHKLPEELFAHCLEEYQYYQWERNNNINNSGVLVVDGGGGGYHRRRRHPSIVGIRRAVPEPCNSSTSWNVAQMFWLEQYMSA